MTLIGIILALIAERLLSQLREWREHAWYARYLDWLDQRIKFPWLWHSAWGLLLLIAAPLAVVAAIQLLLQGGVITLLGLLFGVLVLVFCLGPRDLAEEIHSYLDALAAGDRAESQRIAADLSQLPPGAEPAADQCRAMVSGVLIQGHERLLAVLFWFYVLGPLGAVLYRLSATLPALLQQREVSESLREVARRLHAILAWLPVRFTAALYMLAGSTDDALQEWRAQFGSAEGDWSEQSWRLLARVGCGAMQMEDGADNQPVKLEPEDALIEALALVRRALLLGLGVLAAFTIGGWLT